MDIISTRKRKAYSVAFKLQVVEALRFSPRSNISQIAIRFGVDRKRVREWNNSYDKLRLIVDAKKKDRKKVQFVRQVRSQEIEDGVLNYMKEQINLGVSVKNKDLQHKALEIAHTIGLLDFKASNMWLYRWKKRHNIKLGNRENRRQPYYFHQQMNQYSGEFWGQIMNLQQYGDLGYSAPIGTYLQVEQQPFIFGQF
ncbi:uncharacterized protein TRIADDRAFT_55153 [Trichoplax adhaerens]|uniref:HTH CENPB-type domain-containing protein n=1 Tax=Trichoplax adhaerens TaxID=10228 RepID=B3RU47_TRIAD|nr:hypothetical protein TRIADDRAFT_55153 [Trichoplax adhaerens]EDV25740.1 hypothetical protein TRIADDRAFT_55153 [Trichoplax adhaerens]|eukprot:XP_002111773.1 hypothetical protein TRIADDRAFT_55153 [Trichoplax adhaerens]